MNAICEKLKSTSDLRRLIEIEHGFLFIHLFTNSFLEMAVILLQTSYEIYFWKQVVVSILIVFLCISIMIPIMSTFFFRNLDDRNFLENSAVIQLIFMVNNSIQYLGTLFGFIPKYWRIYWLDSYYFLSNGSIPIVTLILICINWILNKQ